MKTLKLILIKELRSMIRDPKILIAMIIVPVVLTAIMYGAMIGFIGQTAREALTMKGVAAVYDEDHGNWSKYIIDEMNKIGVETISVNSEEELLETIRNNRALLGGIVIPKGFSENISSAKPAKIYVYTVVRSINVLALTRMSRLPTLINNIGRNLTLRVVSEKGVSEEFVRKGVKSVGIAMFKDRMVYGTDMEALIGSLVMVSIFVPLIVLILSSFIAQLSATSIAVEKEEKMLETLLSLPLSRLQLIAGKILASVIIGFIGLILYGGLFAWYFTAVPSAASGGESGVNILSALSNVIGGSVLSSMIASLVGVVLFVLSLAILLALFVEDVRSAQIISGYVVLPLGIAIFLALFVDPASMSQSSRIALSLIPLVNIGFIVNMGFIGDYLSLTLIPVSNLLYAGLMMYIASRIISTERVFTMKLFRRRGRYRGLFRRR